MRSSIDKKHFFILRYTCTAEGGRTDLYPAPPDTAAQLKGEEEWVFARHVPRHSVTQGLKNRLSLENMVASTLKFLLLPLADTGENTVAPIGLMSLGRFPPPFKISIAVERYDSIMKWRFSALDDRHRLLGSNPRRRERALSEQFGLRRGRVSANPTP